jgi:hypothetical protein
MRSKALTPIRFNQIGSFYNFPNWRYLIYLEPSRANLAYCKRKPKDGAGCLLRYLKEHDDISDRSVVSFSLTPFISRSITKLSYSEKTAFYKLFNKKLKLQGDKKIYTPTYKEEHVEVWSAKYISLITDEPLRNFLYHVAKIKYNHDYDFAVKFRNSAEHQRNFCVIGYCIFAGLSDAVIAHRYKLFPGQIRAIRELFFDFKNAPTDVVARAAYFTQLTDNQIISDVDRRYFKIIGSLGELGLKADADPSSLTIEEKDRLNSYLADTMVDNVTSLYFSIEDKKDALAYNTVINNLASFFIKKEEINYYRAKVRHLDASTTRIVNERSDYDTSMQEEDRLAIEMISQLALKENPAPEYKVITELK